MQKNEVIPLVSVVIPCYNTAPYVAEAINSALQQTYSNIEIIVVDDGSTDNSPAIIKQLAADNNFVYIRQENAGVSSARNTGIHQAKGEAIVTLDADDWMYPDNVQEKMDLLRKTNADMVFSWAEVTNHKLEMQHYFKGAAIDDFPVNVFDFAPPPVPSPSSVLVKKSALVGAGLFDTALSVSADLDMWIRISMEYKVCKVEKALIKYRLVPGSMNTNIKKQIGDVVYILEKYGDKPDMRTNLKKFKRGFYYSIAGNSWHTKNYKRLIQYAMKYMSTFF